MRIIIPAAVLLTLALLIFDWHFPKISSSHRDNNKYDVLYENIALDHNRPDFCERISPLAHSGGGLNRSGEKVALSRSLCFQKLAFNEMNASYCDKVSPINTWFLNGSKVNPEECRATILKLSGNSYYAGQTIREDYIRELLQEMNFDYVIDPDYQKNLSEYGEYALWEYWEEISKTDEFVKKAMDLPSLN